jgi:hypothetical protein
MMASWIGSAGVWINLPGSPGSVPGTWSQMMTSSVGPT